MDLFGRKLKKEREARLRREREERLHADVVRRAQEQRDSSIDQTVFAATYGYSSTVTSDVEDVKEQCDTPAVSNDSPPETVSNYDPAPSSSYDYGSSSSSYDSSSSSYDSGSSSSDSGSSFSSCD